MRTVVILAAGQGTRIKGLDRGAPKPLIRLCGLPLIERTIRTAQRAGFLDFTVVIGYRGDEIREKLGDGSRMGVRIQYVENADWHLSNGVSVLKAAPFVQDDFVLVMSDHVVDIGTFQKLNKMELLNDDLALVTDRRIGEIFDLPDATKVKVEGDRIVKIGKDLQDYNTIDAGLFLCSPKLFEVLERIQTEKGDASLSDGVRALCEMKKARSEDIGAGWWQDVDAKPAYKHAEKMLISTLRKPTDVFVSRTFNRPISLFITKYLCKTSVRPDVVSFISVASGLFAPLFLIQGEYWGFVVGAFFYHFSSVLDGCDGELARLKFMDSKRGEWVDTIADNISHVLFLIGLSVGLYVQTGRPVMLGLGVMALFGMGSLLYVMFHYLVKVAQRGSLIAFERDFSQSMSGLRDLGSVLARTLKPLMRRATFVFLFFTLAVLGRSEWILYLMAFGTNIALLIVYSTFRHRLRETVAEFPR